MNGCVGRTDILAEKCTLCGRNLSIEKVSQLSGVKIADIDRLERGEIPIDWKVLARVAGCYDLRPTLDVQPADL